MSVVSRADFKAVARAFYRDAGQLNLYPVSKGTFSLYASSGFGSSHRSRRWTGLDSSESVLEAVSEATRWLSEGR